MANIDSKNLDELLSVLGKKLDMPPEKLRKELEAGKFDSALNSMKPDEAAKFNAVMKNPKLLETLMSSPQAKSLYDKLTK